MEFIDFFSGVGGFTRGMELAGHKCVGHCEIDKFAEASYRSMHTITETQRDYLRTLPLKERQLEILKEEYLNGEWYAADITGVRSDEVPEADCYCFGFPCQAFSIAGNRRGFEDARGTLFFEVMRIAKERKPQILFAENVAGLLSYFGVPQNRERVFLVGHLGDRCGREVFPIAADDTKANQLQGHKNIVSNTLARGDRKARGIYPISGGGTSK